MQPTIKTERYQIACAKAEEFLPTLASNSWDSMVTDPPAGIGFMGKEWDKDKGGRDAWIAWLTGIMVEAHRVMKPGAYGLVWALPRTSHWTATALENAGFEIRDRVSHIFGSGFPKSLDISKALDKAAGAKREVLKTIPDRWTGKGVSLNFATDRSQSEVSVLGGSITDLAKKWDGWGTALKPAMEDWWLIRKPLCGTVVKNIQTWGVGGLNIDLCRVDSESEDLTRDCRGWASADNNGYKRPWMTEAEKQVLGSTNGRWPATLIHDGSEVVLAAFPDAPGQQAQVTGKEPSTPFGGVCYGDMGARQGAAPRGDSGSAARFFYAAKPSTNERSFGLSGQKNPHPTVKSFALMRYLCRLVTPLGGTVGDMFLGSGTSSCAAMIEGFNFVGCEMDPEYHAIALRRTKAAANEDGLFADA